MGSKSERRREAKARWWARKPWPCVLLAVDPGSLSGFAILLSHAGGVTVVNAGRVHVYKDRKLEEVIDEASTEAKRRSFPLVSVLETWGAGGPRGLDQWIGLGEARGSWKRELHVRAATANGAIHEPSKGRILYVNQRTWRTYVVPETGEYDDDDTWHPLDSMGWKRAALRAAQVHFIDHWPEDEDSAEALCMGYYAIRSDAVGKALGIRWLKSQGYTEESITPLEPVISAR